MKTTRRRFLQAGAAFLPVLSGWRLPAEAVPALKTDASGNVFLAPDDPSQWPAFRAALEQWRTETRARLAYRDELYRCPEFAWAASNYACGFLMMWDERFCDRRRGRFRVDDVLDEGVREFGGYDSVVLWHAYPRLGFDPRNQFDFYRDMPGGLEGVRHAVRRFHRRGVRVYLDYNPWDVGTRREAGPDLETLVELVRRLEVDGIFLDTLNRGAAGFRAKLDAARPGVILESEGAVPLENVCDHHASWAQWFGDSHAPGVLRHKWFEPRHLQHQIRRWDTDHTGELHAAWMNGSGMMIWENVFGSWMPWNARDRSILRSMLPIQRRFSSLFVGGAWTPLVPVECAGVFASLWADGNLRLWTLVNRTENTVAGPLLRVADESPQDYFDLVSGGKAAAERRGDGVLLSGSLPPRGIGCFMAGHARALGKGFGEFLKHQARGKSRGSFDTARPARATLQVPAPRVRVQTTVPAGMVAIPAATLELRIEMRVRECGFYESTPPEGHRLADSYRFQTQVFHRTVSFKAFAMDETLVTNAQFADFLRASGYRPRHPANFLKHWQGKRPPAELADLPVVYVDLDDARAYAAHYGKRLPTEEEWQYAAQGRDGRKYPWGDQFEPGRCNDGRTGGPTPVKAFPAGRSPFGCYDLCGKVWQWTESERTDGRTRFCILRGGAWFSAPGSNWYADGGPRPADFAAKFLRIWPGLDRCATIGFRCVAPLDA